MLTLQINCDNFIKMKLDKTDSRLISVLDDNPRMSQSELAKRLRVSQQVVNYRLNKLKKEGVIYKISAVIDYMALGYKKFIIFIKLNKFVNIEKDFFDFFAKNQNIWWAAKVGSYSDVMVMINLKSYSEFDKFIESIDERFPGYLGEHLNLLVLHHELYNHAMFSGKKGLKKRMGYDIADIPVVIDNIDYQILDIIKDDCRRAHHSIGNELGISYKTVKNRIKKLEERKIIAGYRIFHKIANIKAYLILISFGHYSKKMESKLMGEVYQIPEFTLWWKVFGKYNLILYARCKSYELLQEVFTKLRERHNIISKYILIPIFKDITVNSFPHERI